MREATLNRLFYVVKHGSHRNQIQPLRTNENIRKRNKETQREMCFHGNVSASFGTQTVTFTHLGTVKHIYSYDLDTGATATVHPWGGFDRL